MTDQICVKCGKTFPLPSLPSAFQRFFLRNDRYVPPDTDLYVTCPHCHTRQLATERRFFGGLAGPRLMRGILYTFGFVFLGFVCLMLLHNIGLIRVF